MTTRAPSQTRKVVLFMGSDHTPTVRAGWIRLSVL
jgi:hypothetical protein